MAKWNTYGIRTELQDTDDIMSGRSSNSELKRVTINSLKAHINSGMATQEYVDSKIPSSGGTTDYSATIPTSASLSGNTLNFYNSLNTLLFSVDLSNLVGNGNNGGDVAPDIPDTPTVFSITVENNVATASTLPTLEGETIVFDVLPTIDNNGVASFS